MCKAGTSYGHGGPVGEMGTCHGNKLPHLQVNYYKNACGIATATVKKVVTRDGGNELS